MESNKGRFIKGIELVAIVIGLTASIYGLVIVKDALNEYKKDNRLSALIKQDEKEAMLYNRQLLNDSLHSFWAYLPDKLAPKERMILQLRLLMYRDDKGIPITPLPDLQFKNAQELDEIIWSHTNFNNPAFKQLRDAYDFAEEMLFTAESAHTAFKAGILTEEDWETVDTYIDDVGTHPIFIEAIYWGHDGGNYSKAFAEELKKKYSSSDDLRQAALEIYPDIIKDPNWTENMEKR